MSGQIKVEIMDEISSAEEFVKAWKRAEAEGAATEPVERLYFPDLAVLLQTLTPRRLDLLKVLHEGEATSVRALAKKLRRDYKNVHQDVQMLLRLGLIDRTADKQLHAPWERIVAEIRLVA
jgi:predicted transcriptional regulator